MPQVETSVELLILCAVLGYALGSIPFGIVVARILGLGDIRNIGSGNIGATNVLRTGSRWGAAATLFLDAGKGAAALLIARSLIGEDAGQLAGLSAFVGHLYPVWLRFKGGKGVATALGLFLAASLTLGAAACLLWLIGAFISKRSSVGALTTTLLTPVAAIWLSPTMIALSAIVGLFVWVRHKGNIVRVIDGTEPKIRL